MKALVIAFCLAGLVAGCNKDKAATGNAASTPASASAPVASAAPAPSTSDSVAPLESAAPAASAALAVVPTEEQFEQKAQTVISSVAAAQAELNKLEKEIGQ
jgi:hypothetical protein